MEPVATSCSRGFHKLATQTGGQLQTTGAAADNDNIHHDDFSLVPQNEREPVAP